MLLLAYRAILIFVIVSFFSFAALDQPVLRQLYTSITLVWSSSINLFHFLTNISDMGDRLANVGLAYLRSMVLLLLSVALGSSLGLLLGFVSGIRPNSLQATVASAISFVGVLTPSFLTALFIMLAFVRYISPAVGIRFVLLSPSVAVFDVRRLLAPAIVLAVRPLAYVTQVTIGSLEEVIYTDHVRTAHAKGLPPRIVLSRHILRNVALPILTSVNSSFYFSLSSLLVVEWLFNWSGIGLHLLEAVSKRDAETASYLLASIGLTMLVINTTLKVAMRYIDPRLSESEEVVS